LRSSTLSPSSLLQGGIHIDPRCHLLSHRRSIKGLRTSPRHCCRRRRPRRTDLRITLGILRRPLPHRKDDHKVHRRHRYPRKGHRRNPHSRYRIPWMEREVACMGVLDSDEVGPTDNQIWMSFGIFG
jgi:hypothetical protein